MSAAIVHRTPRALVRWLTALLASGALLLSLPASALQPIIDLEDQIVPDGLSLKQVKTAIKRGAAVRKWIAKEKGPNAFEVTLFNRKYVVKVKITYSANSYSITYVSSQNMKAQNGRIHRKYNGWVSNLNNDIQRALYEVS
ncbi:MAG: hypothetical protein AAGG11_08265 [Pseudomonadota bacterium]